MAFIETLQEYLKKEGFLPELTEFGLQFKYETLDFVSFKDEQDELLSIKQTVKSRLRRQAYVSATQFG